MRSSVSMVLNGFLSYLLIIERIYVSDSLADESAVYSFISGQLDAANAADSPTDVSLCRAPNSENQTQMRPRQHVI